MNLKNLCDQELLTRTKNLIQEERQLLTEILHHLAEVDRRKLFSDLGYSSLFDYAVKELSYSEGQAGRRIQALRLIKDIPEVEQKIASGELSLTNVAQAQSFFREINKGGTIKMEKNEKLAILAKLENKSTRDAEKQLLAMQPHAALPKEKERILSETQSEVRFVMSEKLKTKLERVRTLLGLKGTNMNYAELFESMSDVAAEALSQKKFGKKRTLVAGSTKIEIDSASQASTLPTPAPEKMESKNTRYIPRKIKHQVWARDKGCCSQCQGTRNLQYDHILPVAMGGNSLAQNLRLLCFHCNQRAAMKAFGMDLICQKMGY